MEARRASLSWVPILLVVLKAVCFVFECEAAREIYTRARRGAVAMWVVEWAREAEGKECEGEKAERDERPSRERSLGEREP